MRLSRGWRGLLFFWAGVAAVGGIGAGTLQLLGPANPSKGSAQDASADPAFVEFAGRVPVTAYAVAVDVAPVPVSAVEAPDNLAEATAPDAHEGTPEPAATVASETMVPADHDATPPDAQPAVPEPRPPVAILAASQASAPVRLEAPLPPRKLHLRIVRDSERCPTIPCYKWHLLEQRMRPRRPATVDLAGLRLAPSLREAAESGKVELIIDAVEHRKAIHGREMVIFVATNLAGVMPH